MKISKNDPRLTAYVMGELSTEDKFIIDQALAIDPELKNEISVLKTSMAFIKKQKDSVVYRLSDKQREEILNLAKPQRSFLARYWKISASLVTASLALIIFTKSPQNTSSNIAVPAAKFEAAPNVSSATSEVKIKPQAEAAFGRAANQAMLAGSTGEASAVAEAMPATRPSAASKDMAAKIIVTDNDLAQTKSKKIFTSAKLGAVIKQTEMQTATEIQAPAKILISPTAANKSNIGEQKYVYENLTAKAQVCFENNISKYVQYDLNIQLTWQVSKEKSQITEVTELNQPDILTSELKKCLTESVLSLGLSQFNESQTETVYSFLLKYKK